MSIHANITAVGKFQKSLVAILGGGYDDFSDVKEGDPVIVSYAHCRTQSTSETLSEMIAGKSLRDTIERNIPKGPLKEINIANFNKHQIDHLRAGCEEDPETVIKKTHTLANADFAFFLTE